MPKIADVCSHVRSKNAGPFWITLDLFFADEESFVRYSDAPALGAKAVAELYGIDAAQMKRFSVPSLLVVKLSYPRSMPQGGAIERDMHGGQQYARLLDIEL